MTGEAAPGRLDSTPVSEPPDLSLTRPITPLGWTLDALSAMSPGRSTASPGVTGGSNAKASRAKRHRASAFKPPAHHGR